ncbi:MAG: argininosuccinate lyase [Gammaproteobacteria bacterium]|nr:argininosuccinate lyase [Gammaproteobacteria bacterium]
MQHQTWGGAFSVALDQEVNAFQASLAFDHVLFEHDILGSIAHVRMLAKQHLVTRNEAANIIKALKEIKQEWLAGRHLLDVQSEDVHMFIEGLLLKKIGDVAKKLHTGRSRNDQVALDLRLYVRAACQDVGAAISSLIGVLNELAARHETNWMPGYTHLQQAQPVRLGWYFGAYAAMFMRDQSRFQDVKTRLNQCPLGAGALAGSGLPLDRQWVASVLNFDGVIENTLDAVSDRDFIMEFCAAASILMVHLSRMAEDLIIFSTQEFAYVKVNESFVTGSSLMPNKQNPDVLELVRGKTGRVFGHLMGILTVMKGLPLSYNKDMQEDKEGLFDTVKTLKACLSLLPRLLNGLDWDLHRLDKEAKSGYMDAVKIVEQLVLKGMPFREAHHQVGAWVKLAKEKGCSLTEVIHESGQT